MADWRYGDSWEKYPIEKGQWWSADRSVLGVGDFRDRLPAFLTCGDVDMIYCDPPWSKGNANSFVTKASLKRYVDDYAALLDSLFEAVSVIGPSVCYMEIGNQHAQDMVRRMGDLFKHVQAWTVTYYKKHPCWLVRGGRKEIKRDFSSMDEADTPAATIKIEKPKVVADLCTGRGLTLLAAIGCGAAFRGMELNARRLAVAIERAAKLGVEFKPCDR